VRPATDIHAIIDRVENGSADIDDVAALLDSDAEADIFPLYERAYAAKRRSVGNCVYFRALIEFSNRCGKNCLYCGIRSGMTELDRYTLGEADIMRMAHWADEARYGSLVLQSGERHDPEFVAMVERVVQRIKAETKLGITLSIGEQTRQTYARWRSAGAHRYLLRIETSNPELYRSLHPADHSFADRLACLNSLRATGYQVGTGVMIGLPGQSLEDLARDIFFFRDMDVDMIGMGPYIPHAGTPLGQAAPPIPDVARRLRLTLNMIAVTRLMLPDLNIAATTALQALAPRGREFGLQVGANVIMPNVTDTEYRDGYQLYDNKPCRDENAGQCRSCLERRIASVGETIGYDEWGDAPHARRRLTEGAPT